MNFLIAAGEAMTADVVIQNKGAAHSHVPEQRDFYESWINFTVKDGNGKILSESGFLQADGNLDSSAHSFTNRIINNKGEFNDRHQIWHNRVLAYNNTVQSGRSQVVRYRFRVPKDLTGSFSLTATVKYRRFNQHYIDYAMNQKHYPEPVVEMAGQTRTFVVGENAAVKPGDDENKEWMRWNNYGIALLDAQRPQSTPLNESLRFVRTTRTPSRTWPSSRFSGKNTTARPSLAKALELLPGDPRAPYIAPSSSAMAARGEQGHHLSPSGSDQVSSVSRTLFANSGSATTSNTTMSRRARSTRNCRASILMTSPHTITLRFCTAVSVRKTRQVLKPPASQIRKMIRRRPFTPWNFCASILSVPTKVSFGMSTILPATQ